MRQAIVLAGCPKDSGRPASFFFGTGEHFFPLPQIRNGSDWISG
jgi:hypothetical protein